jgi:hypothetical protein
MLSHHCHAGLRALCFVLCSRCVEGVSTVARVGSTGLCNPVLSTGLFANPVLVPVQGYGGHGYGTNDYVVSPKAYLLHHSFISGKTCVNRCESLAQSVTAEQGKEENKMRFRGSA